MGRQPFLAATGLLAGLMSGLLGVGGGILMVPALRSRRVGASWPEAAGTSLAAIIPIVTAGVLTYAVARSVDGLAAAWLVPSAVGGAVVGARVVSRVPDRPMAVAFSLLCAGLAVRFAVPAGLPSPGHTVSIGPGPVVALVAGGLVSGIFSGMFGIGGGVIMVPVLVLALDLPQQPAQGTSLGAALPTAAGGALTHLRAGHVDLAAAAALAVAGVAGAIAGALVAVRLPQLPLRLGFAAWLAWLAVHTLRAHAAKQAVQRPGLRPRDPRAVR